MFGFCQADENRVFDAGRFHRRRNHSLQSTGRRYARNFKNGTIKYRIPKDSFLKVNTADPEDVYNYSFYYVDGKNNLTRIEYILPQGSSMSKFINLRSVDTITEDETNNKVFVMNHRTIGFEADGNKGPLYAFSVGYPKDSRHILPPNFRQTR